MRKSYRTSHHGTQNGKIYNRTTQNLKMSNTDLTKKPGVNSIQVAHHNTQQTQIT